MPSGGFYTEFKEIPVNSVLFTELLMGALLLDLPIINHNNLVSFLYSTQSVGYGN